ncbi:uncharacterized protein LOC135840893 isoform X2 [Planococcus citri]|uniref:uncharacterized protein LOC135840893 isoform X2 n=1 Tax=Planococcus citri TaxID=170843 RepID=UPI0031F8B418
MDSAISKTTYELLSVSDSDSDARQQIQDIHFKSPRRKRLRKRLPSNRVRRYDSIQNQTCCYAYGRMLSLSFIIVILCCWLLILSWLVVIFNDELRRFDSNIMAIVSGNQGIPESVRQCHLQTKELQRNQSEMTVRINSLNTQLNSLSKEISQISNDLKSVQSKLNSSTERSNVPTHSGLTEMTNWISVLNDTVAQLKQSENRMQDGFHTLTNNVTSLKEKLSSQKVPNGGVSVTNKETSSSDFQQIVDNLNYSFTYLNTSLNNEINLIKMNHSQDHHLIEVIQSYLNQTINPGLSNLTEEHTQIAALPDTVKNLTQKYEFLDLKLKSLIEEIHSLNETNKTDKIDIPTTTNSVPTANN